MKPVLLIALFLVFAAGASAQVSSSCTPSAKLLHAYDDDVKDLALKRIYDLKSSDTAKIVIPQSYQDTIWNALAAVCNLNAQLEADSVFRSYCVHVFKAGYPAYANNTRGFIRTVLKVKVDTSYAWAKQWSNMQNTTGNAPLDDLMSRHGFTLRDYFASSNYEYMNNWATIGTLRAINTYAFLDSLRLFPGVVAGEVPPSYGDHDFITYSADTMQHFMFRSGWMDCMLGCNFQKVWKYTISNCSVTLDTVYRLGPPRPSLYNCDLDPLAIKPQVFREEDIVVYPNPVGDRLFVKMPAGSWSYRLSDVSGRILMSGSLDRTSGINTGALPAGVFLLRLSSAEGHTVTRRLLHY